MPLMRLLLPRDNDVARSIRTQWEGIADCTRCIYLPWKFDWHNLAKGRRVIIVSGQQDTAAPPHNQRWLHQHIGGSQLVEYNGTHEQPLKEPAMMAKHVELLFA